MEMLDRSLGFSDDAPKTNPWLHDRLGYTPFAERLSKIILNLRAPNGYVIGLHGEWGSGKSTALNFVRAFLDKHNQELSPGAGPTNIVEFRPWIVSGHQDLIGAFFKVLSEKLAGQPNALASLWKRPLLQFARKSTDSLLNAAATIGVVADPSGGAASTSAANVAKFSLQTLIDQWLAEPSLQAAYDKLVAGLAAKREKFLVIIDDLDRLEAGEIRTLMAMVKTLGQLPNVIYLLAYDRTIVWSAVDLQKSKSGTPSFAEKIIQHEIELPKPSRYSLLSLLDAEISFLPSTPNNLRWQEIVQGGVQRWIRSPRDVLRLSNAIKFAWPALKGEIDPGDLLAIEGLRLFDNEVFNWIRSNKDYLFSQGRFQMLSEDERAAVSKRLRESLPEDSRDQILDLLCTLFPTRSKFIRGDSLSGGESYSETVKRRGVGSEAGYDAYFSLFPSPNAIPKSVLDSLIERRDDDAHVKEVLKEYVDKKGITGSPLVSELLTEMRYRFVGRNAATPTQQLLDGLFEVGEQVLAIDWDGGILTLLPQADLSLLVRALLEAWGPADASKHLVTAFNKAHSAAVCAYVFVDRARELGVIPNEGTSPAEIVTRDALQKLGKLLLKLIEKSAASGTLIEAPAYWAIIQSWVYLRGIDKPRAWIRSNLKSSPVFLAKLAKGRCRARGTRRWVSWTRRGPDLSGSSRSVLTS